MKERTQTGGQAISGLFTMLLFLVFVLCALFSVLMGSRVYENITKRSDENFSGTTALSYIANKIRQGDREDAVDIIEVDGTPVLQLKQKVGDEMAGEYQYTIRRVPGVAGRRCLLQQESLYQSGIAPGVYQ